MRLFLLFTGILTFSIHVTVPFLDVVHVVAPVSMLFSMRAAAPNDTNSSGTQLESVQCPFVCMYATPIPYPDACLPETNLYGPIPSL